MNREQHYSVIKATFRSVLTIRIRNEIIMFLHDRPNVQLPVRTLTKQNILFDG